MLRIVLVSAIWEFRLLSLDTSFAGMDLSRFWDDSHLLEGTDSAVAKPIVPQNCVGIGWIDLVVILRLR